MTDLTPLPIPTCLYREPASPGVADIDRASYTTDCATPHHGELYFHGTICGDPAAPYPGDTVTDADANQQCYDAFEGYIGVGFDSSRLGYLYYYPRAETWADGDRSVDCVVYAGDGEELVRGALAATGQ